MCAECGREPKDHLRRGMCISCYRKWHHRVNNSPDREWPRLRQIEDNRGRTCHYCNEPAITRGYCKSHYERLRYKGWLKPKFQRQDGKYVAV